MQAVKIDIMTRPEMRRVINFWLRDSSLATCAPLSGKLVSFFCSDDDDDLSELVLKFTSFFGVSVVSSAVGAWDRLWRREDDMILALIAICGRTDFKDITGILFELRFPHFIPTHYGLLPHCVLVNKVVTVLVYTVPGTKYRPPLKVGRQVQVYVCRENNKRKRIRIRAVLSVFGVQYLRRRIHSMSKILFTLIKIHYLQGSSFQKR